MCSASCKSQPHSKASLDCNYFDHICGTPFPASSLPQTVMADDRSSLLAIYTTGGSPSKLASWSSPNPCDGSWTGITCKNPKTAPASSNFVTALYLPYVNLKNRLDIALGNLTGLTSISFQQNTFYSQIPRSISLLTNLQFLRLAGNKFTGPFPEQISTLTSLGLLDLGINSLVGSIPSTLSLLTSVTALFLNNNQLTGTIPGQLSALAGLQYFGLDHNLLSGSVPSSLSTIYARTGSSTFSVNDNEGLCGPTTNFPGLARYSTALGKACPMPTGEWCQTMMTHNFLSSDSLPRCLVPVPSVVHGNVKGLLLRHTASALRQPIITPLLHVWPFHLQQTDPKCVRLLLWTHHSELPDFFLCWKKWQI